MQKELHTYFNGKSLTLDTDHIQTMERRDDRGWGPEHGPKVLEYTRVVLEEGCETSQGSRVAFVSETPEEIMAP